ncbi:MULTISPECIES: hypothetical protein [Bacillaceae]|uniref:Uncharacterized protein n=1 Tax=Evansella alkalicola TaxID=745819 RepID=A0ABS6K073_9BACI|nr:MULTISPECIES: hypothetical protein [Bacillaceae]MBU9722745.1 hypothetical protein [Bacillus alkalicola]
MLAQYLWAKWVGIIIKNSIYIGIVLLAFYGVEKLFNTTFNYLTLLLGGLISLIILEIIEYKKWLRNGATSKG